MSRPRRWADALICAVPLGGDRARQPDFIFSSMRDHYTSTDYEGTPKHLPFREEGLLGVYRSLVRTEQIWGMRGANSDALDTRFQQPERRGRNGRCSAPAPP